MTQEVSKPKENTQSKDQDLVKKLAKSDNELAKILANHLREAGNLGLVKIGKVREHYCV